MRFWLTLLTALVSTLAVSAREARVRDIDIQVKLYGDGRALFVEKWNVDTGNEISELYLPKENLGDIGVEYFKVTCDGVELSDDGAWDVDRSRAQKAGRYGIVRKRGGVELCWGVGEYGQHLYSPVYIMTNTVKSLNDYDMFHMQVLADRITGSPHVRVSISMDEDLGVHMDTSVVRVWGFGYDGTVRFEDGSVVFESGDDFNTRSSVIALIRFKKGIFSSPSVQDRDFQEVLDQALVGSHFEDEDAYDDAYDDDDDIDPGIIKILTLIIIFFLSRLGYYKGSGKPTRREKRKLLGVQESAISWYRDIPMGGDLLAADYALTRLGEDRKKNALASAEILRMIYNGYLDVQKDANGKVEISFAENTYDKDALDPIAKELRDMMLEASGSDRILQDNEFSSWSKKHKKRLYSWTEKMTTQGKKTFRSHGWMPENKLTFTPAGQLEAQHLLGFRKYLNDFTLTNQRETIEVHLWQEYLVFGTLLGVADKVARQLKDIDPVLFEQTVGYDYGTFTSVLYSMDSLSRAITNANRAYAATSTSRGSFGGGSFGGFGGHSSFGGGGGFSGGGHGFGR